MVSHAPSTGLDASRTAPHIGSMWRPLASALIFLFLAASAGAEARPQGLLWNRSGLPATLPLQMKTNPGADYLLRLRDVETGQDALAAYIRGGAFFRLLVPAGRYELRFATGTDWQGEGGLFGPDTRRFALDPPLSFAATVNRKEGHLIDLRDPSNVVIRGLAICQWRALDPDSLRPPHPRDEKHPGQSEILPLRPPFFPVPRYDLLSWTCD